jgi:Spy/CpxP family protein refolding chaperone
MTPRLNIVAATLVAALGCGFAAAQSSAPPAPPAPQQADAPHSSARAHDLLTPEERQSFRERMQQAQTREERQQVRDAMHALAEQRAKEKGVTLQYGHGAGPGYGQPHGHGVRQGVGPGSGAAAGAGWGRLYDQVFTQEERDRFREQMRNAQTAEERAKLWWEQRALTEQRAKDKGIALPGAAPGTARGPGAGFGLGRGPGPRDGAYGQLFTAVERGTFHAKMRAAQTPDERAKLWADQHALAEQRAKERGITLPAPGYGHGGRGGVYAQLFTPEEREVFRTKMRAAQTPEERAKLWADQRALAEQRAKEKGITLPPVGPAAYGPGAGRGPGGWGGGTYRDLFTADERNTLREKMQAAATPEERARLWSEQRALAEQRAQEKGIPLPPDRGPGFGRGPGAQAPGVPPSAPPAKID